LQDLIDDSTLKAITMTSNGYQVPDLASVLKTLASLTPAQQAMLVSSPEQARPTVSPSPHERDLAPSSQIHDNANSPFLQPPIATHPVNDLADPSIITEWSAGLRHVMKTVAARDDIIADIRKMIRIQHQYESEWWAARQALIGKQEARVEGQKKLDDVMKLVGGKTEFQSNTLVGSDAAMAELKTYNMKVYRAQLQMIKQMRGKLITLGIPFFGTRPELVRPNRKEATKKYSEEGQRDEKPGSDKRIDEDALIGLQKKMLGFLEELCKEI